MFVRVGMDTLRQDLLYAVKVLRRDPAYSAAVILTLAVCLGANTAIFTVVRSVLLRPLPYPEPQRIVSSYDGFPGAGVERAGTSVPNYGERRAMKDVFASAALYQFSGYKVGQGSRAEGVVAMNVTPSFFEVLGTAPSRGRLFSEAEGTPGKNKVVLVSSTFAARQAGGVDGIVGTQLRLNDEVYDVVGVLPRTFYFINPDVQLFVPIAFAPEDFADERRHSQNHEMLARLAPGVTLERAQSQLDAHNVRVIEGSGAIKDTLIRAGYITRVQRLEDDLIRNVRAALQMLWGGVLCVVLIAAVNITNLALARTNGRMKELATRSAIGAGRSRIGRQLITEAAVLTLAGGALGVALGVFSLDALEWIGFTDLPRANEIQVDAVVVAVTIAPALLLAVVVGGVPALRLAGASLSGALREETRSGTSSRTSGYVRRSLVVAQVALAFLLVAGAGLLLASFGRLLNVSPGFVADQVITGRVNPLRSRYPDDAALRSYVERALARVRALPGVESAGVTSYLPFSYDGSSNVIIPEGYAHKPGESVVSPNQLYVSPGYLEALKVSLKGGRLFNDSDTPTEDVASPGPNVTWLQVVGVVGAVKLRGLEEGENARVGAYYVPYAQDPSRQVGWAIRTTGDIGSTTAAVQRALAEVDPDVTMSDVFAMTARIEKSLNPRRAPMMLALGFGAIALLLASVGLYGVLAYHVGQRTREFGIRMALGSDGARILRLILGEAAVLVVMGLAGGLAGTIAMRGVIAAQLYGIGALDPQVILAAVGILAITSLVACLGPALRAVRVSPMVALSRQ
jgi:predicted permease